MSYTRLPFSGRPPDEASAGAEAAGEEAPSVVEFASARSSREGDARCLQVGGGPKDTEPVLARGGRRCGRWCLLGGLSAIALLAWSTAALVPNLSGQRRGQVDAAVRFHFDEGQLRWRGGTGKCLEVEAGPARAGAHVQVLDCDAQHQDNMRFTFPREVGLIRWASHPDLCLSPHSSRPRVGTRLVLQPCNETADYMYWVMPESVGAIRMLSNRTVCINERGRGRNTGASLGLCSDDGDVPASEVWDESLPHTVGQLHWWLQKHLCLRAARPVAGSHVYAGACNIRSIFTQFVFPGKVGMIHWAAHPHLCLDVAGNETREGQPLRLWHCHPGFKSMHWEVPAGHGPVRSVHRPDACLGAAGRKARLTLGTCAAPGGGPPVAKAATNGSSTEAANGSSTGAANGSSAKAVNGSHGGGAAVAEGAVVSAIAAAADELLAGPSGGVTIRALDDAPRGVADRQRWIVVARDKKWKHPSLLCLSVMRVETYEHWLLRSMMARAPMVHKDIGIFDCDEFAVYSSKKVRLGWHHREGWVHGTPFPQAEVGVSKDGTAGNAQLFINMWRAVRENGRFRLHPWTVKVDPDAVMLPFRLRRRLEPLTSSAPMYLENCNAFPESPDYPMFYGAVEVISREGLVRYYAGETRCKLQGWWTWGEDLYMSKCLRMLGVAGVLDETLVGDARCKGAPCWQPRPAYHPFKSQASWFQCWHTAVER